MLNIKTYTRNIRAHSYLMPMYISNTRHSLLGVDSLFTHKGVWPIELAFFATKKNAKRIFL